LSQLPGVSADTWEDFKRVFGETRELQRDLFERAAYIQFTPQPASEAYDLERIRADFPEGSCIGFSNDGSQALGAIETFAHRAFPSMGFGFYMLAVFVSGQWQIAGEAMRWVA
jgi:hypothetical protein